MTDIISEADLRELIRLLYEDGLKLDEALPLLRIDQSTFDAWCDQYPDEEHGRRRTIELAETFHEMNKIREWNERAKYDWRAARDFLAWRWPERWSGKPQEVYEKKQPTEFVVSLGNELWGDD